MKKPLTLFERASLHQLEQWVKGISIHNDIVDECVPDLSCCDLRLYPTDDAIRETVLHRFHIYYGMIQ